jgi:hypothetical protein
MRGYSDYEDGNQDKIATDRYSRGEDSGNLSFEYYHWKNRIEYGRDIS